MTEEQVQSLEKLVNEKIFQGVRMYPTLYESIEDPKLKEVRGLFLFWEFFCPTPPEKVSLT